MCLDFDRNKSKELEKSNNAGVILLRFRDYLPAFT